MTTHYFSIPNNLPAFLSYIIHSLFLFQLFFIPFLLTKSFLTFSFFLSISVTQIFLILPSPGCKQFFFLLFNVSHYDFFLFYQTWQFAFYLPCIYSKQLFSIGHMSSTNLKNRTTVNRKSLNSWILYSTEAEENKEIDSYNN